MKSQLPVTGALAALVALAMAVSAGCSSDDRAWEPAPTASSATPESPESPESAPSEPTTAAPAVPDLVGLPSATAAERIRELDLGSTWGPPVVVGCEARPGTVVRQRPAAGTPVGPRTTVRVRTATLDLERFRGPCEPADGAVQPDGPVAEADLALARTFYEFAADPSLGAPFAGGGVWVGIEDGPTSTRLAGDDLGELGAWELETEYAERSGPFSALDLLALSGGYYALREGVAGTCPDGDGRAPDELDGLRAISLTAPSDVTSACLEWWGVTLFLDPEDRIHGVALRLGSP